MRVLSLFSGIGGLELGLEWAGMETVGQCEFDRYCRNVLEKHWPTVPRWIDIRSLTGEWVRDNCGHIDLICGGFPCQDISVAGKGAGIKGERSGLWQEMRRVIGEVRPRWVLAENVPALRTRGADEVLAGLEELGYACWPCVVAAQDVGALHRRQRVFIVAHTNSDAIWQQRQCTGGEGAAPSIAGTDCQVSNADDSQREQRGQDGRMGRQWQSQEAQAAVPHADCQPPRWATEPRSQCGQWLAEPAVGRVANGVPSRMDRLRCLGNAVVPQVAEQLGRAIMEVELAHSRRHRAAA